MKEQQRSHHRHNRYISRPTPNIQPQWNNRFRSIPLCQHKRDRCDERSRKKSNDNRGVPRVCVTSEVECDDEKCEPGDEEAHAELEPVHTAEIIDTFGTLSVAEHGVSRFFGPTGGSEVG